MAELLSIDEILDGPGHRAARVHDEMVQYVDADLIGEFERTHREARAEPHGRIDRLDRHAFPFVDPGGLLEIRAEDPRRDEPGDILPHHDDRLAEGLRQVDRRLERRIARRVRADDFDERHEHGRVEEVHPDDLLRSLRGRGHVRDRQGGRIRRQDCLRRRNPIEFAEDLPLQLRVLEDGLDHKVRVVTRLAQLEGDVNPSEGLVCLLAPNLLLLDELVKRPANPLHAPVEIFLLDVPDGDIVAVKGGELRDAVAHLPCADDCESHSRRSLKGRAPSIKDIA